MNTFQKYFKGDPWIWTIVFILSIFGTLAVYSATGTLAYVESGGNTWAYLAKHTIILMVGLVITWLAHMLDFRYYSRIAQMLLYISIPLLLYTMVFGKEINGAARWIQIPLIGLSFQTSDLAKLGLIMYVARFLSKRQDEVKDAKRTILPILGAIILICLLIFPSDFSTATVLFMTSLVLLFIGRVPIGQLALLIGGGLIVLSGLIAVVWTQDVTIGRLGTVKSRIETIY